MTLNSNDKSLIQEDASSNNLNNDKLNDFQLIKDNSTNNSINNLNSNDNLNINSNDDPNDQSIDNNLNENSNDLICSSSIGLSLDNQTSLKNDLINDNKKDELIVNKDSMETNTSLDEDIEMTIDEIEKSPIKKKDNHSDKESPKKRIKSTPKKDKLSPLIRQPKLQINDKTMKKLKSDTDDLIFDTATDNQSNNNTKYTTTDQKLKNNLLVPVVSNVLSRSIAAIFCNSPTINKNGEFNSYSALGFNNKGPRVKRVCRSFNDVYKGMPRAVFPINLNSSATSTTTKSLSSTNKSNNKSTNSPNKRQNKKNLIKQSSASTSNSNSSFKIEDDLETECSYDSDDLDISEYIARNLKKEMQSSKDVC